ncbi:phage head closure protein [Paracoccus marcusii]|uniref:phage head closure protein n=1 Tax=Paracoccus marcusii TaxID=59779 RepID=UPI003262E8A8
MIDAGKLDRLVTFERLTETVRPSGAVVKTWAPFLTVRAEVQELQADDAPAGFGTTERQALAFLVRWNPVQITTADRVTLAGRSFDIRQITDLGRREGWKLVAVAT